MKQQQRDFDVVFMDFLMPIMDGLTAMKMWSAHLTTLRLLDGDKGTDEYEKKSRTLLIGMSATSTPPDLYQAFECGMNFFCPKPVCLTVITAIIDAIKSSNDIWKVRKKIGSLCTDSKSITRTCTYKPRISRENSGVGFGTGNALGADIGSAACLNLKANRKQKFKYDLLPKKTSQLPTYENTRCQNIRAEKHVNRRKKMCKVVIIKELNDIVTLK
eukprot:gene8731-18047_t